MKHYLLTVAAFLAIAFGAAAQGVYHVSPTGDDTAAGTAEAPFATIQKAVDVVEPGETIYVHAGTYYINSRILIPEKATTETSRIRLFAYGDGEVIVDGSKTEPKSEMEFKMSRCMYLPYYANYWHIKGLTFQNAKDNGVKVEGSYNIFERCVFRNNNDTGLQIGMFKDWSIEETKSFPISGTPAFNPGYTYCRGNKVINCDSYNNYDKVGYGGKSDDGGDADGFACKLFPGPGTEFIGCRAWNNSDDNWDLYMVYHPVVIANCWAWYAAYDENDRETGGNGNGFKLGGGGSSGGAAFTQSTGAHVVYNCVSFSNYKKGFDQNNAYEGMYLFNNVAWDNDYNFRFPTIFEYGGMHIRNCVGFLPRTLNHEFLSESKDGSQVPNTAYNSWTTIDGCDPYKDGNKVGKERVYAADHSAEFLSLSVADAKAERLPDGSLPENNLARLRQGSIFVDAGEVVKDFVPVRFMTEAEATAHGVELITAEPITIEYNGAAPDMGAYESGTTVDGRIYHVSGPEEQTVYVGTEIEPIVVKWGGAATDVKVDGMVDGLEATRDMESKSITIAGTLSESTKLIVSTVGGETVASLTYTLNASTLSAATLTCTSNNANQVVFYNHAVEPIVFEAAGGATGIEAESLPKGLEARVEGLKLTITGYPEEGGRYTVTATGGMVPVSTSGSITMEVANRILTGDWYHIDEPYEAINAELKDVVSIESSANYKTVWDPTYTESGSVPGGCTAGAVNVERGGALVWNLPSLMELKANVHFTGGRYLQVKWKYADEETEHTWTSDKLSKTTLVAWDLMKEAGIKDTDRPVTVKFVNPTSNNGGIRVYDFFVRVYADGESGVVTSIKDEDELSFYATDGALILNLDNVAGARLYSLEGRVVAQSIRSSIVPLSGVSRGNMYLLQVLTTDGRSLVKKVLIK
ncbi:MAG: DUF1565 domain-containing protein [Muribaculaceae bacterium]|nr:DUF1565 domain-containing protein [Muribaculaceae bacterium]